jgi:hypothetical protein
VLHTLCMGSDPPGQLGYACLFIPFICISAIQGLPWGNCVTPSKAVEQYEQTTNMACSQNEKRVIINSYYGWQCYESPTVTSLKSNFTLQIGGVRRYSQMIYTIEESCVQFYIFDPI